MPIASSFEQMKNGDKFFASLSDLITYFRDFGLMLWFEPKTRNYLEADKADGLFVSICPEPGKRSGEVHFYRLWTVAKDHSGKDGIAGHKSSILVGKRVYEEIGHDLERPGRGSDLRYMTSQPVQRSFVISISPISPSNLRDNRH